MSDAKIHPLSSELNAHTLDKLRRCVERYDGVALALQGGGALGAYQAGVIEALAQADIHPNYVAGVSIGAINSAIYAGNPPERRVERLRTFWERITASSSLMEAPREGAPRRLFNQFESVVAMASGASGFFFPRPFNPWLIPTGWPGATSFYDPSPLKATLEELVDWDLLNSGQTRVAFGAVNVRTGDFRYFDSNTDRLRPEHVMASGALPPGFPAVEIDGDYYWDGGLVSNTPLHHILTRPWTPDTLVFQVDLFSAAGQPPLDMPAVLARQKEILYSSRTRSDTNAYRDVHRIRAELRDALRRIPADLIDDKDRAFLAEVENTPQVTIVHLIYQRRPHEGQSQDYEFSRASMLDHWRAGWTDASRTLAKPERMHRPNESEAVRIFDIHDPRYAD